LSEPPATSETEEPEVSQTAPLAAGQETLPGVDDLPPENSLRLQLDAFEGPFEVLLYLIRSQEIDIFNIPILRVTEQYLQFLDMLQEENLDVAGEFLVMAATLIQIKSRMLIPADVAEEEEEEIEEEDPRLELVEKLLEYRKFRDYAEGLGRRSELAADWFARRVKPVAVPDEDEEDILDVSLYDLIKAIRAVLRYLTEAYVHEVQGEGSSIEEKIGRIEELLESAETLTWRQLFDECRNRVEIVCCLLAVLELCRMRRIRVHQHGTFCDMRMFARPASERDEEDRLEAESSHALVASEEN